MQISVLEANEILKSDSDYLVRICEHYGIKLEKNKGLCPFHNDHIPSLSLKGNRYKCFVCGEGGDLIDLIRNKEGINYIQAIKKALEILGLDYTVEKDKLDNLKDYITEKLNKWYKDESFVLEDVYFYKDENDIPVLARIKYKNKKTSKKQFSQANIVDLGNYYKLDFKSNKFNLIYNMPKVIKSIQENKYIFLVEGEKDADNLSRLGFTSTTCREINSVNDKSLEVLQGANLIVIADNDNAGQKHIKNIRNLLIDKVKSFRNLVLKEIYDLGEKADISDFIEAEFNKGKTTKDIRNIIFNKIDRTLNECNKYELQQDKLGVYKTYIKVDKEGNVEEQKIYLTNFNVQSLNRIENIDTDEEIIELILISNLGEKKKIIGKSNKVFLDPKSFNSFMNMGFYFDGKPKDLNNFKAWINKYFLLEKRNEYLITGIREIDNKKMLITPNGALLKDGTIDNNYKANNQLTLIDFTNIKKLNNEEANELAKHIFNWNTEKNCYNVLGSLVSNMFNSMYRESNGINVHVTSLVGESGSGKSFTIDNIIRPLLNLDNDTMVFSSIMPHGLLRALNDTYMATIIDEVKPSQAGEYKRQLLSNTIRSITGESTVVKGTQNQGFKTYKYNSSLIIAGEEALDETALKNRCNIIWFSCNDMSNEIIESGNYFISKNGKRSLKSLGMEIYLYIMNNFNSENLLEKLNLVEESFQYTQKLHPRIQATFNNTMFGYIVLKHVLIGLGASKSNFKSDYEVSELIYQNLKENVLDGEYATKQIYDEILESIDELASGTGQYVIAENTHYKQDSLYLKLDIKSIYPILESYYRSRGKTLKLDCKTFVKMLTKSKYVEGDSKQYYKVVNLNGKSKRCYFILKDKLKDLDMPVLIPPPIECEWEDI